jgi:outer membrane protein assembly factor BamB
VTAPAVAGDVTTYHNDNARTGQNLSETILTPANLNVTSFGRLFVISVDGKVDAEPLYLAAVTFPGQGTHNALYVVTEHDSVYAFDADTGAQLWKVSVLKAGETTSDGRNCGQVTPEIGITSTPVISRSNGTIYVVAMSKDASTLTSIASMLWISLPALRSLVDPSIFRPSFPALATTATARASSSTRSNTKNGLAFSY